MVPLYSLFVTDKTPHRSPEHHVIAKNIPPPLAINDIWSLIVTVCHLFPVILAFVSGPHLNTWVLFKIVIYQTVCW